MQWYNNMKIGKRMAIGFGLLLVIMVVLIWEGTTGMSNIQKNLERIVKVNNVRIELVNDCNDQISVVSVNLRNVIMEPDDTKHPPLEKKIADARAKYDEKQKKDILEPVLRWFEAHASEARPLSESSYGSLADLLLNPANHYGGLYSASEPSVMAIRFVADGKIGYILLHFGIVEVLWNDTSPSALLNAQGSTALQNWIQENG